MGNKESAIHRETLRYEVIQSILPVSSHDVHRAFRKPISFIMRDPGAEACLSPVAELVRNKGISVNMITAGTAEERAHKKFPERIIGDSVIRETGPIVVSADMDPGFGVAMVRSLRLLNPEAPIVVLEDMPNSVDRLIQALCESCLYPALIFTPTCQQAEVYQQKYSQFGHAVIVPIGQPAFDISPSEESRDIHRRVREQLHIAADARVLTFIAHPLGDLPTTGSYAEHNDLTSITLGKTLDALTLLAWQYPDQRFDFIYRPHPREREELWVHPLLYMSPFPQNLRIHAFRKEEWGSLTTKEVSLASDVAISIASTAGQELILSGLNNPSEEDVIPVNIVLSQYAQSLLSEDSLTSIYTSAVGLATQEQHIVPLLEESLFGERYRDILKEKRERLAKEYRKPGLASFRAHVWTSALERRTQEEILELLETLR